MSALPGGEELVSLGPDGVVRVLPLRSLASRTDTLVDGFDVDGTGLVLLRGDRLEIRDLPGLAARHTRPLPDLDPPLDPGWIALAGDTVTLADRVHMADRLVRVADSTLAVPLPAGEVTSLLACLADSGSFLHVIHPARRGRRTAALVEPDGTVRPLGLGAAIRATGRPWGVARYGDRLVGVDEGQVWAWDLQSDRLLGAGDLVLDEPPFAEAMLPLGPDRVVCSSRLQIELWEVAPARRVARADPARIPGFSVGDELRGCALPDGRIAFGGARGGGLAVWDPATGRWQVLATVHPTLAMFVIGGRLLSHHPAGGMLVDAEIGVVRTWDLSSGALADETAVVGSVVRVPGRDELVVVSSQGVIVRLTP